MRDQRPPLPRRAPINQSMAATLRLWASDERPDARLLQRIATGLRTLSEDKRATATVLDCHVLEPISGNAHAHRVMSEHAAHRCPRYHHALAYVTTPAR